MSIVAIADGPRQVTADILHEVAAQNNITIPSKEDEEGYLLLLESLDAVVKQVDALPDYIDPSLAPVAVVGGERKWWKEEHNSRNAWSHRTYLRAEKPTSYLLSGRTVAIKDNVSVADVPFTAGTFPELLSKDSKYPVPQIDAPVVSRVLLAGAMIMGTASCENYSLTPMSYTSANGPMHNPWLYGYNAGGSSSGNAFLLALRAARAAGVPDLQGAGPDVDMAVGGDQAGSIRLPAAYSGVYGLKPTYGLVPYTGIASHHALYDHAGPMAKNLQDIATLLEALAGYDGLDPRMTPETPLRENIPKYSQLFADFTSGPASVQLGTGLKVGLITESFNLPGSSKEVSKLVRDAAHKHFTAAGAIVSDVSIPLHLLGPHIWTSSTRAYLSPLAIGGRPPDTLSHPMPHLTPRWPPDQEMYTLLTSANPAVINVLFSASFLHHKYPSTVHAMAAKAQRHVLQLRAAYDAALAEYDVLVTPTTPTVAPPMPAGGRESASVLEKAMLAVGATNNTCPFNVTGHPGLSVPCGWARAEAKGDEKGGWLPVGMQIVGRRWDDIGVLKAGAVFESGGGGLGEWPGKEGRGKARAPYSVREEQRGLGEVDGVVQLLDGK